MEGDKPFEEKVFQRELGWKKSSSICNISYMPETAANEQTATCMYCRQNRRAAVTMQSGEELKSVVFSIIDNLGQFSDPKAVQKELGIKFSVCCEIIETEGKKRFKCPTFGKLVRAHRKGVEKRGCLVDPCQGCDRYWNKDHPAGMCRGKFVADARNANQ